MLAILTDQGKECEILTPVCLVERWVITSLEMVISSGWCHREEVTVHM